MLGRTASTSQILVGEKPGWVDVGRECYWTGVDVSRGVWMGKGWDVSVAIDPGKFRQEREVRKPGFGLGFHRVWEFGDSYSHDLCDR